MHRKRPAHPRKSTAALPAYRGRLASRSCSGGDGHLEGCCIDAKNRPTTLNDELVAPDPSVLRVRRILLETWSSQELVGTHGAILRAPECWGLLQAEQIWSEERFNSSGDRRSPHDVTRSVVGLRGSPIRTPW
jgi:hypothetical protein